VTVLRRVLLADADAALARTLAWMLKQSGYDVSPASSIETVESRLMLETFDLVLLDLSLLAAHPPAPALERAVLGPLPVIAVAAHEPDAAACGRIGLRPGDVLRKPFQVRELLQRMTTALREAQLREVDGREARERAQANAIFGDIVHAHGFDEFARVLVRGVSRALGIPRVSLILARPGDQHGIVVAASENPTLRDLRVDLSRYPEIEAALRTDGPVLVGDVHADPLYDRVRTLWQYDALRVDTVSAIAMRFQLGQTTTGVFFLRTSDPRMPLVTQDVTFARRVLEMAVSALAEATAREAADRERAGGTGA
jgi:CheY-like chemotaxis protein